MAELWIDEDDIRTVLVCVTRLRHGHTTKQAPDDARAKAWWKHLRLSTCGSCACASVTDGHGTVGRGKNVKSIIGQLQPSSHNAPADKLQANLCTQSGHLHRQRNAVCLSPHLRL